jgi:gluconate 2-dehydrogenase gamma chain
VDEAVGEENDIRLPSSEQTVIKRKLNDMSRQDQSCFFDLHQRATIAAAMARIIPTDDVPGASEAGCVDFVDLYLGGIDHIYAKPDGSGFETLSAATAESWTRRIGILRQKYLDGIRVLDAEARARFDAAFFQLDAGQQDEILTALEHSGSQPASAGGPPGEGPALQQTLTETDLDFLPLLIMHTRQGFYCDPIYGGNKNRVGWDAIGFPGPTSLMEVFTGRFSALPWFAEGEEEKYREANRGA